MSAMTKLYKIPFVLQSKVPFRVLGDRLYLSSAYRGLMNQKLSWDHPQTFNEKLQVMKLDSDRPEFTGWADKQEAKKRAAALIGPEYIIPDLASWDSAEEIKTDGLPERFVLKATHDSGSVWIIDPEHPFDETIRKQIDAALKRNYYNQWREGAYRSIRPKVIAEKFMGSDLRDYKFFCFHGDPRIVLVCSERSTQLKEDFFDAEWNHLDMRRPKHPNADRIPEKPEKLEEMLKIAKKLSEPFDFVRVDLFEIDGRVFFGEMTFFPACGFEGFEPASWDALLGSWI